MQTVAAASSKLRGGAFSSPGFRWFFAGLLLLALGATIGDVGQRWLVQELTNSPFPVGLVVFANSFPMLLFSLPAGVLADRVDRVLMIVAARGIGALLITFLGLLTVLRAVEVWQVVILAFIWGALTATEIPGRQSLFPTLVKREHLMHAVAVYSGVWSSSLIVAPAIAGWVIGWVGTEGCFFLTGALQCIAVALFFQVKRHANTSPGQRKHEAALAAFTSGIRNVRKDPVIAALVLTTMGTAFLGYPSATALLPSYAAIVLAGDATVFGSLLTAMGVGALAVNLVLATGIRLANRGKVMLGLGALWGMLLLALAHTTDRQTAQLLMGLIGAASAGAMTLATTLTQLSVNDDMRGRVMSVFILTWGLASVGGLGAGALGSAIGVPNAITVGGLGTLVVVALAWLRAPGLLRLE